MKSTLRTPKGCYSQKRPNILGKRFGIGTTSKYIKLTAEKLVRETPLPQASLPPLTPQLPFEEVMVKLLLVPEIVNVASVWVDQVPADRRPPTAEPDRRALMVAFVGKLAGAVYNSYSKD